MRVLIIGCGYVGKSAGAELVRRGHEVFGLRRNVDEELERAGIRPLYGDVSDPGMIKGMHDRFDWVVNSVAAGGDAASYRRVYFEGTQNLIDWLAKQPPQRYVYTSSTSVYGQDDGSVVTEESPTEPENAGSQVLVETESLLREAANRGTLPAIILRCAGIYGPGRGYWLQQFLRGEAVLDGAGDRWLNMIHRDDVAGAVVAALEHGTPGEVYNVADDEPVRQRTVFEWLASRLNRPMPPSNQQPASSNQPPAPVRRRGASNKKVSNQKLKLEVGWELKYPTFREGYEAEIARLGGTRKD